MRLGGSPADVSVFQRAHLNCRPGISKLVARLEVSRAPSWTSLGSRRGGSPSETEIQCIPSFHRCIFTGFLARRAAGLLASAWFLPRLLPFLTQSVKDTQKDVHCCHGLVNSDSIHVRNRPRVLFKGCASQKRRREELAVTK